ncbi:MAG: hypothetical protein WCO71_10185 [Pseudomonadota bacterium]
MGRKYHLDDSDLSDDPLRDPHAAWRRHEASEPQMHRLKFFGKSIPRKLTKGSASDLISDINPTNGELESYNAWKAAGRPDIAQWHKNYRAKWRFNPILWKPSWVIVGILGLGLALRGHFTTPEPQPNSTPVPVPLPSSLTTDRSLKKLDDSDKPEIASPRSVPTGPVALAAQQRAIAKFPQLAVIGSPINRAFLESMHRYQTEKPHIFDDPEWPTIIATDASRGLH